MRVPQPGLGTPTDNTFYNTALLSTLVPATTYHYSVSNDGSTWSSDATFTTAPAGPAAFRFTAFGDQAASASRAAPMVSLAASFKPAFHVLPGDLAYATTEGEHYPDVSGFLPSQWDKYFALIANQGARSIPWQPSVGAHEVEPLGTNGYDGFLTRFPQAYAAAAGAPLSYTYSYGNVGVVHLDGNDLSAQETINNGYTGGAQSAWLDATVSAYRLRSDIDFIVAVVNCCCYSSNQEHGSDGGLRDGWGPTFDTYAVDLVISGHVHAYERTHPMRAGQRTRVVDAGGYVYPETDGTTYICAGGGGNGLYSSWYGSTDKGDAGSSTAPKIWRWSGGDTASGGSGKPQNVTDPASGYSAVRQASFSCLVIDVSPPAGAGSVTTMKIRAVVPTQTSDAVTSLANPAVIDTVFLSRIH